MKIYSLHSKQKLPISKNEAWDFLSNPKNLQKIMPTTMGFEILSGAERPMYTGQILQYNVTPFKGFSTKWVTEITHVQKPDYFVDVQLYGPYALWHHKHFIHETEGGVEMEDIVHYKVPLGILGQLVHPFIVKPKLDEIFNHRKEALETLFGKL